MFLFSQKGIGELWQDAGAGENNASGEIRGMAHHGRASWGVVAASARCKAMISLGFSEIFKRGVLVSEPAVLMAQYPHSTDCVEKVGFLK